MQKKGRGSWCGCHCPLSWCPWPHLLSLSCCCCHHAIIVLLLFCPLPIIPVPIHCQQWLLSMSTLKAVACGGGCGYSVRGTLRFVRHFLQYFSVTSVCSSSSSLVQDRVHLRLRYRSPMITWCSIPITVSPFSIISLFFIILLFRLRFLVYRHASHLSRALSFSFKIPC